MSESLHKVYFLLELVVPEVYVSRPGFARLEFVVPEHIQQDLVLVLHNREDGASGPWSEKVVCRATAGYDVDEKVKSFVEAFIGGKVVELAPGLSFPHMRAGRVIAGEDGSINKGEQPKVQALPLVVQDLLKKAHADMYGAASRFLHLLRWQQGAAFTEEVIQHAILRWNVGGTAFHAVPSYDMEPVTLGMLKGLSWEKVDQDAFETLWALSGQGEPEPHKLYWLAESLRINAPRASVLVLVAALESSAKRHIERHNPDARWVVNPELKSPSLGYLLETEISKVFGKERIAPIRPWIHEINDLIDYRDTIAHDKAPISLPKDLAHYFRRALDLLYYFDVVDGHEWAKRMLSLEMCRALGWPPPPPGFGSIQMKLG